MPTGYTADLYEGKDVPFREFALRCSRAMGAAVMLRDSDGAVVPTPENVNPGYSYAETELPKARAELARWQSLSRIEVAAETEAYNEGQRKARQEAFEKKERIRLAYEGMLEQVEAWEPPSEEHVGLKEFMVEQLTKAIEFDCGAINDTWYATRRPNEHKAKQIESLTRTVERLEQDVEKERERNEGRTEWVRLLYESLPDDKEEQCSPGHAMSAEKSVPTI